MTNADTHASPTSQSPPRAALRSTVFGTAKTIAIGVVGGALFASVGTPLPWLSGSALAVAIAALAGQKLNVAPSVRTLTLVFLGATMGAAVKPETLQSLQQWPLSLVGLGVAVVAMMIASQLYLRHVHGFEPTTAKLAAVPGALPYVLALAEADARTDVRRVAIVQTLRLSCLLMALPGLFALLGVGQANGGAETPPNADLAVAALGAEVLADLAILFAAAGVAAWVAARIRLPAGALFGPMIAGAALYASGAVTADLPDWLMLPGFVVIGAMVGAHFDGTDLRLFGATVVAGILSLVVGSAAAMAVAIPVAATLGLSLPQVWLAYAPGGVETMSILALALGFDAAYVAGHHAVRFLGLGLLVPFWLGRPPADQDVPSDRPRP
ncbi:MAG: AbrB family transcriptional regulator [Pseudomonadota bacterium]